jgi:spermidine/putrescine transport system substrate-binding protein
VVNEPRQDAALLRGLTERRIGRRDLFRYAGLGAGALGVSAFLASCGVSGTAGAPSGSASSTDWKAFWAKQQQAGVMNFANWPAYIDTHKGTHPSLDEFKKQTGITVNYKPVINNNDSFYATIRPPLEQGKDTGWDLIVISSGPQLSRLIKFGWLIPLDLDKLPNFKKYGADSVKDPNYDPDNTYTITWQSGLTGIGVNRKYVKEDVTSLNQLFDARYEGHIGMMSDNTELGSAGLLTLGIQPSTSTPDQWTQAAAKLQQQKDDGLVRNYYDQSYLNALQNGDIWVTQAWSGDIFSSQQIGYPELEFVVPDEGAMIWHDNMMIPLHAQHPLDAITYMNYVYEPKVAAEIADWVWYMTPVPAAKQIIAKQLDDPTVANSPLVFPDAAITAKMTEYYDFKDFQDEQTWNDTFQPIIDG